MLIFMNIITNIIVIAIIALIIGGALIYIIRSKIKGKKCIGCPYSKSCSLKKNNQSDSSCNCGDGNGCR